MTSRIIVVSNDVVPGMGVPVAAPGLRAFGIGQGLEAHGFDVTTLVVSRVARRVWRGSVPPAASPGIHVVRAKDLRRIIAAAAPATVILINSNQLDHLRRAEGVRYVVDFFAPKMLELAYQHDDEHPKQQLAALRDRKLRAIEMADAFIVNGAKKVPYFLGWLLQSDRDVRHLPLRVVNMPVPVSLREHRAGDGLRLAMTGYLQEWSRPGGWLDVLIGYLDAPEVTLDLVMPQHWSGRGDVDAGPHFQRVRDHPSTSLHDPMIFSEFQAFLRTVDVAIDLFDWTLEREYAMVTRSVVALAAGVPVVHPPFTEVSPLIAEFDAGWLVDPADEAALDGILDALVREPHLVEEKAEGAARLAVEKLDPRAAVGPLVETVRGIWG